MLEQGRGGSSGAAPEFQRGATRRGPERTSFEAGTRVVRRGLSLAYRHHLGIRLGNDQLRSGEDSVHVEALVLRERAAINYHRGREAGTGKRADAARELGLGHAAPHELDPEQAEGRVDSTKDGCSQVSDHDGAPPAASFSSVHFTPICQK